MTDEELRALIVSPKTISKREMNKLTSPVEEYGYYRSDAKLFSETDVCQHNTAKASGKRHTVFI